MQVLLLFDSGCKSLDSRGGNGVHSASVCVRLLVVERIVIEHVYFDEDEGVIVVKLLPNVREMRRPRKGIEITWDDKIPGMKNNNFVVEYGTYAKAKEFFKGGKPHDHKGVVGISETLVKEGNLLKDRKVRIEKII